MKRYRTIVADPPWPGVNRRGHRPGGEWWSGARRAGRSSGSTRRYRATPPSYAVMDVEEIAALPFANEAAEADAHLYLWIPDCHLIAGHGAEVARAWGFEARRLLIWHKTGYGLGTFPRPQHEALIVCQRGRLSFSVRDEGSVHTFSNPYRNGGRYHSAKPEEMQDLIERASPGPYLELFARRPRPGWDVWGDQV